MNSDLKSTHALIQKTFEVMAETVSLPKDIEADILTVLRVGEGENVEAWRAVVRYFVSMGAFLVKFKEDSPDIPIDSVTQEVRDAVDSDFVWGKVKRFYPELQDVEGVALANRMIKAFLSSDLRFSRGSDSRSVALSIGGTEKEFQALPKFKTKRATEAVLSITKVEDKLFNPGNFDELFGQHGKNLDERADFRILTDKRKTVVTLLSVDWDERDLKERGISIPSWNKLTAFDRAVYTAVGSLFFAGNGYITSRMVFQVLSGNKAKANPTPDILRAIAHSIERMSIIRVSIDAAEEARAKRNVQAEYTDYLLNTRAARVAINGVMSDCIQIHTPPVLYMYANGKNQIARMNVKMLDAPVSNTSENIELKSYLMRRVSGMKSDKSKLGNAIRYDTIYEYLGLNTAGYGEDGLRHKKKDVRDAVQKILEDWTRKGEIKSFEEVSEGRTKTKVVITMH